MAGDTFFVGLLDLKKDAIVSIDGQAIVLKTDDFLGIHEKGGREGLHLIAAKANSMSTLTSAFLVYKEASLFVRKYDPQTEELSSQPVDKLTVENLHESLPQLLGTHRVLNYSNIVSDIQSQQWKFQTSYILSSDILRIRSIDSGEKLVPGSAEEDDDTALFSSSAPPTTTQQQQQDGKSISYPPIPVVDSNLSVWQTKHAGTKRYLHQLNPTDRTNLFLNPEHTANQLFQTVLANDYQNSWQAILGDLQLSYTMFLYVQCFSSLEHWKDLVAMLCLVDPKGMQRHKEFYRALVEVLPAQIATIEQGFLEDMEEAGNNFLLPLLKRLLQSLSKSHVVTNEQWAKFQSLLKNRFPNNFIFLVNDEDHVDDMDEEDAPIIVSTQDIEASLARSSAYANNNNQVPMEIRQTYPLLVAAMMPQEDILMACARALDDAADVSLVREAAAYLEQVEQRNDAVQVHSQNERA